MSGKRNLPSGNTKKPELCLEDAIFKDQNQLVNGRKKANSSIFSLKFRFNGPASSDGFQTTLQSSSRPCREVPVSPVPLDICGQARELVEVGKTSVEVGALQDIKPGTFREWKRRYMWDGSEAQGRSCNDDMDTDQVPAEYERVMSLDVMDTLDWIRRMPMPRRIDAILKRERALELLSKRSERVIGGFA